MATLVWSDNIRNTVAQLVCGRPYADIKPDERMFLDAGGGVGAAPAGGVALQAYNAVQQDAQWFELAGLTGTTDATESYFTDECALRMARRSNWEKVQEFTHARDYSQEMFYQTVTRTEITEGFDPNVMGNTVLSMRRHVVQALVKRQRTRRLRPAMDTIDAAGQYVATRLWNECRWLARTRFASVNILVDGSIELPNLAGEEFDELNVMKFVHQENEDGDETQGTIELIDADDMARLQAAQPDLEGQPKYFRFVRNADDIEWTWYPWPDQDYLCRAEIAVKGPGEAETADSAGMYERFPAPMQPFIRKYVLAVVLDEMGEMEGQYKLRKIEEEEIQKLVAYEDRGVPDLKDDPTDTNFDFPLDCNGTEYMGGPL